MYEAFRRNNESTSKITKKGSVQSSRVVSGKLSMIQNYGGLGSRYFARLVNDLDKIFQVNNIIVFL